MTESIDVSVVIPTHSERRWASLQRTVASAQQQKLTPAEIIVVVDHNPELFKRCQDEFPGVTVLENTSVRGASGNRNTGAFHSRSELIAFLDDDTVAHPTWLGHLARPFDNPAVVGAGGSIVPAWERTRPSWMPDELLWTVGVSYAGMPTSVAEIRNVWSASMMVRREAFLQVGGFRVGFGKLGDQNRPEDTELCLRISAETGGHWMYVPDSVIEHDVPLDRSTFRFFLRRCYAEGRGKVQMAGLLPKDQKLGAEQNYIRRTLPRAVASNLKAATLGRGGYHALRAATVIAAVAAAGVGGGVETLAALSESESATR
ncbi:glycosyltransferase family 2 protein [Actinoplanes sp. LDG1-06]|uniref:Glycosyltransferase family 2 protein n=1 Tax=Paractinoplanes ovalisporus TaxID=2810368 RepID=A0ABS2AMN1_9ACTN|nr:glycosyltransferase family 2 protein [Actinoplanes ovalisporus]MBM2621040.1 glycosyltransferase family 2 protein [Actinoplanes ovalisporus]